MSTESVISEGNRSIYWSNNLSRQFLYISSFIYLAAIGTNFIYVSQNDCGFSLLPNRPDLYAILLLGLIGFEIWVHRRFGGVLSRQAGIWLLGLRIVFYEIAASLDCSNFAVILYILLPFLAYIFINKWAAYLTAIIFTLWTAIKAGSFRCPGCSLDEYITPVLIMGVGMLWSVLISWLVIGMEKSRRHTKQLLTDLETSHKKLSIYAAQVEELVTVEERNRIAREIHDSVGHSLAVVNVQLEKALVFHDRDSNVAYRAITDAKGAAQEALNDVRNSVRTLRQTSQSFSLIEALSNLSSRFSNDDLKIEFHEKGSQENFKTSTLMALYRIAQEALTNVYKHAKATHVDIDLELNNSFALLSIHDNGIGFIPDEVKLSENLRGQFGLHGIKERLEILDGDLRVESAPEKGTTLIVKIHQRSGSN